jgi:Dyp-type peroxidase family
MPDEGKSLPNTLDQLLSRPIKWASWNKDPSTRDFLIDLQANILKGHGRDHTGNVFISFAGMKTEAIKGLLHRLTPLITTALEQLREATAYRNTRVSGGRIACFFLARGGYEKLAIKAAKWPSDLAFQEGMRARGRLPQIKFDGNVTLPGLNDPSPADWDGGPWAKDNPEPDAMILIADDNANLVTEGLEAIEAVINGTGARVLGVERGEAQRRKQPGGSPKGEGIEHFGYVDGRSQPLFLEEDVLNEPRDKWDPAFPPSQFLIADPGGHSALACGSYFVFRKLEQNVKMFKEQEAALAEKIGLTGKDAERAGALVVGRFEDGTPVVTSCTPQFGKPINDFDYKEDSEGIQCPFRAHIRKTNPRGEAESEQLPPGFRHERERIMARRGITYGQRKQGIDGEFNDRPMTSVGLLFMAYMTSLTEQFEFTQAAWVNNADFVRPGVGVDGVLSQRPAGQKKSETTWTDGCSGKSGQFDFKTAVKLKGGEYFFAPSLSFLRNIDRA